MKFEAVNFKKRMNRILEEIPKAIEEEMHKAAEYMLNDITSTSLLSHSVSWQRAVTGLGPHYFIGTQRNGLLGAIEAAGTTMYSVDNVDGKVSFSFGKMHELDAMAPYWPMFERDFEGEEGLPTSVRTGGSDTHGFVPKVGFGKSGEGFSKEAPNVKPNPGVLGVNLFGDAYLWHKPVMEENIKKRIEEIISRG